MGSSSSSLIRFCRSWHRSHRPTCYLITRFLRRTFISLCCRPQPRPQLCNFSRMFLDCDFFSQPGASSDSFSLSLPQRSSKFCSCTWQCTCRPTILRNRPDIGSKGLSSQSWQKLDDIYAVGNTRLCLWVEGSLPHPLNA